MWKTGARWKTRRAKAGKKKNYERRQESKKLQTWTRNVGRGRQVGGRADHPTAGRNGAQQAGSGME